MAETHGLYQSEIYYRSRNRWATAAVLSVIAGTAIKQLVPKSGELTIADTEGGSMAISHESIHLYSELALGAIFWFGLFWAIKANSVGRKFQADEASFF